VSYSVEAHFCIQERTACPRREEMMKRILRRAQLSGLLLLVGLMTTSCIFGSSAQFLVEDDEEGHLVVYLSAQGILTTCERLDGAPVFSCDYFYQQTEQGRFSDFTINGLELAFLLLFLDPVVMQVPQEASNFSGTYTHTPSGTSGDLMIQSGLSSLRADATQSYQAEAGMQLVIIDLPSGTPTSGQYTYNFSFTVPDNLPTLNMKALFTGKVAVEGETYYLPLLPCTADMAAVPTISVPLQGGTVPLPTNVQGCDDVTFTIEAGTFNNKRFMPLVDQ
jgi:hypothetical protein